MRSTMGNAFVAGLKNEAPRGRDITNEDRNSEVRQRGTQRDADGSEFSYNYKQKRQKNYYRKKKPASKSMCSIKLNEKVNQISA